MKTSLFKLAAAAAIGGILASCTGSPQDQFGYAVKTGNVQMANSTLGTNYANMRVYENPTQYSVPMQFAIIQNNTRMAGFLLDHGAHRSLDGKNLAYYSSLNGHQEMADFFIRRGIGSRGDISLAANQRASWRRQQGEQSQTAGLIALGILAAGMSSGSSSNNGEQKEGFSTLYSPF